MWSAGDNRNGGFTTDTAEIYSPPYLFEGPRPELTAAPESVALDATFTVSTSGPAPVRAVLVAPGATTHGVDMNQRHVELRVVSTGPGTTTLQAPLDGNAAPYGLLHAVGAQRRRRPVGRPLRPRDGLKRTRPPPLDRGPRGADDRLADNGGR